MRALVYAWIVSLALVIGGGIYLLSYEPPKAAAEPQEREIITKIDRAPVLSSGIMEFDASLSPEEMKEEDCPTSC